MAIIALCVVGSRSLFPASKVTREIYVGPDAALEMYGENAIRQPGALGALRSAIERLPESRPIKVFARPGDDHNASVEQLVLYLAWPRSVDCTEKAPGAEGDTIASMRERYSAIILCGWHSPDGAPGVHRIGPELEVVPLYPSLPPAPALDLPPYAP